MFNIDGRTEVIQRVTAWKSHRVYRAMFREWYWYWWQSVCCIIETVLSSKRCYLRADLHIRNQGASKWYIDTSWNWRVRGEHVSTTTKRFGSILDINAYGLNPSWTFLVLNAFTITDRHSFRSTAALTDRSYFLSFIVCTIFPPQYLNWRS